ncbi:hypothetical protein [Asticcacaulis sp. EMRT-3]|uniref:hypothetical protein n=1 Tax=Asticcacaulis sp. EMRT-3 TaxID=3040349 RepID=UPI0024AE8DAD|nr:hypothetical protein [Asticcacaulis sp. EMRT-3]MDI7775265.1 hypothetical protein [Asticcacaulis sp. EMRT-3]
MPISRRSLIASSVALGGLMAARAAFAADAPATAAAKPPLVLYDDGLQNGWQDWSWGTTNHLQIPAGNVKPIKVEGGAWSALDLHHDPMSTAGYTKLTFYINGGVEGGQTLGVHVKTPDGKSPPSTFTFKPEVKKWGIVEVPLKDIGAENTTIADVFIQGGADPYKPYYIDKIQFE